MQLDPIGPLGAQATGIDLSRTLSAGQVREIEYAMDLHGVLVFRGQPIGQDQQIAFAKSFGPLDVGLRKIKAGPHRLAYHELADISNVNVDGAVTERAHAKVVNNIANLWHSDSSFQRPRAKHSMLAAVVVPGVGGDTEFADLRLAYEALPDNMKRKLEGLQALHSALHSRFMLGDSGYTDAQRQAFPPVTWPLVPTDPRTGRRHRSCKPHA